METANGEYKLTLLVEIAIKTHVQTALDLYSARTEPSQEQESVSTNMDLLATNAVQCDIFQHVSDHWSSLNKNAQNAVCVIFPSTNPRRQMDARQAFLGNLGIPNKT